MPPTPTRGRIIKPLHELTATEIVAAIGQGTATCEAVTRACLDWIAAREGEVHAWAYIDPAAALARLCGVTPPTMNTVLKNLQERGLIERTPHEWHRNVLETRLTDEGRAVMELADAGAVRVERALAAAFTGEERELLIQLLGRCAEVLDAQR